MKRVHAMPFGARYSDAATRFRLWAPACERVGLQLGREAPRQVAMRAAGDGWHEIDVTGVKPGEPYAFRISPDGPVVPDPASRANPWDVSGPSAVVNPEAFAWTDAAWLGRPWSEAVVYELHVGTFTSRGTFASAIERLDYLRDLGVTVLELMPLADFAGRRNWGYDGVLQFAPDSAYGAPEDLKHLVDEAHRRGLSMMIDVVYNHFGPEGNYLPAYAPQFFNPAHQTPWGSAINFDGEHARTVRDFFVHNALYWLEEFHFDGLRMDAVHAIADDSPRHIVTEIAEAIAAGPGRKRHIHQVLENDANQAGYLERTGTHVAAQWNDDSHHAWHVITSGESDGYYGDYAEAPLEHLGRTLTEGFAYQGEPFAHRNNEPRGERSGHLPPEAFVNFLQNHDQVGNRAMGERLVSLSHPGAMPLAMATLLLAPAIPMLYMGEEYAAETPFLFFCDFHGELADAVREGRRKEFAAFARHADPQARARIPDPNDERTFFASKLAWSDLEVPRHAEALQRTRELLRLRKDHIVPHLADRTVQSRYAVIGNSGLAIDWTFADGAVLHLRGNYGTEPLADVPPAPGSLLHTVGRADGKTLAPWSGRWSLETR